MTDLATVPDLLGTSPADLIDPTAEQPASDRDMAVRRAERIRAGIAGYAAMRQEIADAYAQRDWRALDYGSWYEYVREEFGQELAALDRSDRREAVADLRQQGMSTRQIASATGVSVGTVHSDLAGVQSLNTSTVNGSDGKSYPATKPRPAPEPEQSAWQCFACKQWFNATTNTCPTCGGFGTNQRPAGTRPEPPAEPERPKPPAWDPDERRAHEAEVSRLQAIRHGQQAAKTIVTEVTALVVTVVSACREGEDLVTPEMVAELRKAIDLLEGEIR